MKKQKEPDKKIKNPWIKKLATVALFGLVTAMVLTELSVWGMVIAVMLIVFIDEL